MNETEIARAHAENKSDLADISDYAVRVNERESLDLGIEEKAIRFEILRHERRQSVWALVEKIAAMWLEKTCAREPSVEIDELTRAFLILKKAEYFAGRIQLSEPISADEIRARNVNEEDDDDMLSIFQSSIRELDERITKEENDDGQSD
ncbi:hypothetical protein [Ruegeria lacuscaerulensis]|uniref:hypothetical protein n=1 Tax=Ruegeria lacuscaerulensis TaxID=55218 RepID=UPI001480E196|nr:hypothetical protein [Ruegeria lacuscaerulensis]